MRHVKCLQAKQVSIVIIIDKHTPFQSVLAYVRSVGGLAMAYPDGTAEYSTSDTDDWGFTKPSFAKKYFPWVICRARDFT